MGGGGRVGGGDQGRCEQGNGVFGENSKKKNWGGGSGRGGVGAVGVRVGGQGGCERRIEVFVKIKKKFWGGAGRIGSGGSAQVGGSG